MQVAAALGRAGHAAPHRPQLLAEVRVSTSQPSSTRPLQSAKPASQEAMHMPRAHTGVPLATVAHAAPQAPQWVTVTRVSTSHPSSDRPLQSAKEVAQVTAHRPASQAGDALAPVGHALPQAPQWLVDARVLT